MKKHAHIFLKLMLCIWVLFSACNSSSTSSNHLTGNDDEAMNAANEIIAFNNKLVKADNSHASFIRTMHSFMQSTGRFITTRLEQPDSRTIAPATVPPVSINTLQGIVYPNGWSKTYQPMVKDMEDSFDALKKLQKEVDVYREAEDWKEDNGEKLTEFNERIYQEIDKNRAASEALFTKIRPEVDQAEEEVLKGHPLKDPIIQSKRVMSLALDITNQSYDATDLDTFKAEFEKQYDQLEKMHEKNSALSIPDTYKNKERSFNAFNDAANNFLGKMRIIKRELEANSELTDSALNQLDAASQSVLRAYNSFVD